MAVLMRLMVGAAAVWLSAVGFAQVPAGARSGDDHSREEAWSTEMREAESALEQGDFKGAETKLKVLAAAHPKDGRILYDLGFAEERNGEEVEAAKAYAGSFEAIPGFAEPKIALGLLNARSGRTEAAHKDLLEVANLQTAAPELRARAMRALAQLDEANKPAEAQEELLAALKLTGETPADVLMGAELAERAGDATDAEAAYRRALKLMPEDVNASAGLGHVLQKEGKLAEADAVFGEALKAHPDDARLVAPAVSLYAVEGKEAQAIPMLEHLRAEDPKMAADEKITRLLAQLYAVSGKDAEAEKIYLGLVASEPGDPTLLDGLGSAQTRLGQYGAAEATFSKALSMRDAFHDDNAWGETAGHLAFVASRNNDPKMCLQALTARATVLANSATSLFLEATAHDSLHQSNDAARAYQAFLAMAHGKFPDQETEARHRLAILERK